MSDDLSHDTHLRAALRHAPDHALAPPAGVSQTILNAARQVHRPARAAATPSPAVRITTARPRALAWLHRWFVSPRLASGLATGLVAALGLGLWFDLGEQPVIDRAPIEAASEMRSTPEAPAAPPRAAEPSAARADDTRDVPPARPPTAAPEAARAQRAPRAAESAKLERKIEPAPPPREAPATPPAAPERREDNAAREPEAALAKAPAPAITADSAAPLQQRDASSKSDQRMSLAAGRAAAAAGPAGVRASVAEAGVAAEAGAAAAPALVMLRRARIELASGSARWTWTPPRSPLMAPFDAAGQAWLARVVQASRGRWTDTSERAAAGDALEVRWWRDDWPHATLRVEAEGLRWIEHSGPIRYAPLDAATLQRLRNP